MMQQEAQRGRQPALAGARRTVAGGKKVTTSPAAEKAREQGVVMAERRTALAQSYYDAAKRSIASALSADEKGDRMEALERYNKALSTIRSGVATLSSSVASEEDTASMRDIRNKMNRMKEQVKSRMEELLNLEVQHRRASASQVRQTERLADSQTASTTDRPPRNKLEAKADLLFNIDTGISLFEVDGKEHVSKYEDVDALSVFRYREPIRGQPPAFLQCGGFVYPLVRGKSPVLKAGERTYTFPELRKSDGSAVGVVLDGASEEELTQLDQLLAEYANLKTTPTNTETGGESEVSEETVKEKQAGGWGTTVAGGIDRGVNWVSTKIGQGTELAGNLITKGADKLREKIEPNEVPTEIPNSVQKGVYYTKKASDCVVGVSDFLMTSLAKLTVKIGSGVADMISESEAVREVEVNPHAVEAWKVTKSSLKGVAAVFSGLERAAGAVVRRSGEETANTVGHKYGEAAGKVTGDSISTATNATKLAYTYWSWKTWGIQFLGKVGEVINSKDSEK